MSIYAAEKVGSTKVIPAFLDPNLKPEQLKYGVSFASAASGYDELTSTNAVCHSLEVKAVGELCFCIKRSSSYLCMELLSSPKHKF